MKLTFSILLLLAAATQINAAAAPGPANNCIAGSFGKGNGDGFNGFCCKTQADCIDDCVKGVCNGPKNTKTTSTKTSTKTTTTHSSTHTSDTCIGGSSGKGNDDDKTSDDRYIPCIKGKCDAP